MDNEVHIGALRWGVEPSWPEQGDEGPSGEPRREITWEDVEAGEDPQGIPWRDEQPRVARRVERIKTYETYVNEPVDWNAVRAEAHKPFRNCQHFAFDRISFKAKSNFFHFQLRQLVWATSNHDVYLHNQTRVLHYNTLSKRQTRVLRGHGIHVSTICVRHNLLAVGGLQGDMMLQRLNPYRRVEEGDTVPPCQSESPRTLCLSPRERNITNALHIARSRANGLSVWSSTNDCCARAHDGESLREECRFDFDWAVNCTDLSPSSSSLLVVGDSTSVAVVDTRSGAQYHVDAHRDYAFGAAWSPFDENLFATGAQDATCRLWDARQLGKGPLAIIPAVMGAVRSIRFSPDGRYIAFSEPEDFVHVLDATKLPESQLIDLFGEVTGCDFSPDGDKLFVGLAEFRFGGLLEYCRRDYPAWHDEPPWSKRRIMPDSMEDSCERAEPAHGAVDEQNSELVNFNGSDAFFTPFST